MKFLVKFDLEFDLKFDEISDGKNLVKFWGRTFPSARKAQEISGRISGQISEQISEKISETSFQISRLFSETSFSRRAVLNPAGCNGSPHEQPHAPDLASRVLVENPAWLTFLIPN